MPPVMGAIIFIMAEWLDIHYGSVALMAALPAILYYMIVFSTIHFEALKSNRPVVSRSEVVPFSQLLRDGWIYTIPLAALIMFLLVLKYEPEQSVLFAIPILIASSFLSMGVHGTASIDVVGPGIAEALITTIAGLGAAIPAVVGYNLLLRHVRRQETRVELFVTRIVELTRERVAGDGDVESESTYEENPV